MAVTTGTLTAAYVGAVPFLTQRDINPNIFDTANEQQFTDTMALFGRMREKKMWNFHTFVNDNTFQTLTVGSVTSGSGSANVVIVLSVGTSGFARIYDRIKFVDGTIGIVRITPTTSAGADTLTIRSVDGSNITVTAADILAVPGNAVAEQSDAVVSRRYGTTKYLNYIQIFREGHTETDVEKLTKVETTVNGQPYYGVYNFMTKFQGMKSAVSATMIDGKISTGSNFDTAGSLIVDAVSGLPIQTTSGLDQWTTLYGISSNAATPGTIVAADIDNLVDAQNAAKAPLNFMGFTGTKGKNPYDTYLKNLGSSGVTSARMNVDNKDVDLEVDKFSRGIHSFEFVPTSILNHPQLFNYAGSPDIKKSIYWVPKGQLAVVGGGNEPYLSIGYKKQAVKGGYGDDVYSEFHTGALAPVPTSDVLKWQVNWVTYQGLDVKGAKHLGKQVVAA